MNQVQYYLSHVKGRLSQLDPAHWPTKRTADWLRPHADFLRELLHEPRAIGAVCPSSCKLAARMAHWVNPAQTGWVVELGGGTGTVTRALLAHGVPRERLIVIEQSQRFADHLRATFRGTRIVHANAADIASLIGSQDRVAAIVSGLPLRSLPIDAVSHIVLACAQVLNADSRVVQFTYASHACSAWQIAGLQRIAKESVWHNLPPAHIEVFTPAITGALVNPKSNPAALQKMQTGLLAPELPRE